MNTDHVQVVLSGVEGTAMRCNHCTLQYFAPLPMPIDVYVEQAKGFALMHRRCVPAPVPSPQLQLPHHAYGIDGASDESDPETDPPAPRVDHYQMFDMNYPKANTYDTLVPALREALTQAEFALLDLDVVHGWHPSSGQFDAVAHWARVENAHKSHAHRKPTPGITLPARLPMPGPLAQALAGTPAEKKRRTTRKAALKK